MRCLRCFNAWRHAPQAGVLCLVCSTPCTSRDRLCSTACRRQGGRRCTFPGCNKPAPVGGQYGKWCSVHVRRKARGEEVKE